MNHEILRKYDPQVYDALIGEEKRIQEGINLIPSENYTYPEVLDLLGSVFTDKYSEGYPGKRYYGGNQFTDIVESLAIQRAKEIFGCEHVNVQPLSGSPMNVAVYFALLNPGDTVLGMDLSHGGHLTHGHPVTHMGKIFNFVRYKTDPNNEGKIDFDDLMKVAKETKPKIVLCGYTSYPRDYNYADFKKVADEVGAITMADVSHIGGLIAAGAMANPFDFGFDVVTTTTHKSLRGPRGGMIMCKEKYASAIDKAVFPGLQGGPHMNNIAALAATLNRALMPEFKQYGAQILLNAKSLAKELMDLGAKLITDGTDNHMMVINTVESFSIDGTLAEKTLEKAGIIVNKQVIPDDPNPPLKPSGIRLGTPALTTRGMKETDMIKVANWIYSSLKNFDNDQIQNQIKTEIELYTKPFLIPCF